MGADNKGICRKEDALKVVGGDGLNKELLEQALLELTPLLKFSLGQGNHVAAILRCSGSVGKKVVICPKSVVLIAG